MRAKSFLIVCGGLLCLTLVYHLGAMAAQAQSHRTSPETSEQVTTRALVIVDERGRERARLSTLGGQPSLMLTDEAGELRAALALNPDGSPRLTLSDEKGTVRAGLQVTRGSSVLTVADNVGAARIQAAVAANGFSMVSVMDEAGTMRAAMGVGKNSHSRSVGMFTLLDAEKDVIWQAPK